MEFSPAPIIETERLRMRSHVLSDFDAIFKMWSDPLVVQHISGTPQTKEESWAKLLRNVGHWTMLGFGYWVVEERASNRWVGEVGFANWRREIVPPFEDAPEMGWVLTPEMHGKGYATEAVRAALAWGDQRFGPIRSVCIITPENRASIRVAEKCGYKECLRTTYRGSEVLLFDRRSAGAQTYRP